MPKPPIIPYARQNIESDDIEAVVEQLHSLWITQGPKINEFEESICELVGAKYATAVSSCTAAIHISCLALGLSKGDRLWTVPNTFVASSNAALYCGAEVDFVDIDPDTYCMSMDRLEEKLVKAKEVNLLPKIVVAVHFAGHSCNMKRLKDLSDQYGFFVIEDAAHAMGGTYLDFPVGSSHFSDITVFSFHPVKILTTGEGGMAVTNRLDISERLQRLRTHGIVRDEACLEEGDWYYEMRELGYHYRMTDIQAALGCSQVKRLKPFIDRRRELVKQYHEKLQDLPLKLPQEQGGVCSAWHLYVVQNLSEKVTRKELFDFMRSNNVVVNVHYIPVYWQPVYQKLGFERGLCPVAEAYYENAISIPMFYELSNDEQDRVVQLLKQVLL